MLKNIRCYSVNVMHFDLSHLEPPRQRSEMHFFLNISIDMLKRELLCVTDIQEITYGLSFYAITFDLFPKSKFK